MLTHTDRNGTAFAYAYNAYRAPLSITAQNGEHSQSVSYTYDPVGNRKTMTDDTGTTSYTYDFLSRLTSEEKDGKLKTYRYNKYGERTNIRVTDGTLELYALDYVYDAQSRNTGLSGLSLTAQLAYDANGRMTKKTLGNVVTDYTYNDMGAVTSLTARRGTENLYRSVYGYERSGNLISDEMTGKSASLTKTYTYDGMNRLTGETIGGTAGGQPLSYLAQYTFDAKNNITKVQRSLTDTTGEVTGTYDLNNRLLTAKTQTENGENAQDFTYDPNGSRFASLGSSLSPTAPAAETAELAERDEDAGLYEYDLFNRLIGYQKGDVIATYTYNGDGQRMSKTVNGKTTQFIWDGMNMIIELSVADGDIAAYIYGPSGLLARNSSQGGLLIYTTNAHGDVTAATKQLGGAAMEYYYDAYGNVIHATNAAHTGALADNPFLYCGEYTDLETGFIYLRNRYYDPEQRRFITEDPAKAGLNWYVYANNNPILYIDPLGLDVYYYVAKEFKDEASRVKDMLEKKFNEPVHIIEIGEDGNVYAAWENMGTNEEGDVVNISAVIINTHANSDVLAGLDLSKLKGKTIDTVLLLGCNAGNLDHIYTSPMSQIINSNNTGSVIAADGSVYYSNRGLFKDTKRTKYYFKSRDKDNGFVSNLLPVNKDNKNRNPVGFIKYTLYDGVLYDEWLGREFENINSIFNAAGIYDRPSKNPN